MLARRGTLVRALSPRSSASRGTETSSASWISSPGIHHLGDLLGDARRSDAARRRTGTGAALPGLEVLTGSAPDARSDVFTIGTLAFEMATGKPAFGAATLLALIGQMLREATPDPRPHAPSLPEAALLPSKGASLKTR